MSHAKKYTKNEVNDIMKRKIFVSALAVMMIATLMGCGKEENPASVQPEKTKEDVAESITETLPAEGADVKSEPEVAQEKNTVDMTIEEYVEYVASLNPSDIYSGVIFGVQTPSDAEHICSKAYQLQMSDVLMAVDERNSVYSDMEEVDENNNRKAILSDEAGWFYVPRFASYETPLNADGVYSDISFEYDSAVDAMTLKSAGNVLAYFGEARIDNDQYSDCIVFTTHLTDGDFVVYIRCNTGLVNSYYPIKSADGKTINFVTHH